MLAVFIVVLVNMSIALVTPKLANTSTGLAGR